MKKIIQPAFLLLSISMILLIVGCKTNPSPVSTEPPKTNTPASLPTPGAPPEQSESNGPLTVSDAEKLAGFDVMEPAYLPKGVYFASAIYQKLPSPSVTLQFNLVHEQYGDRGRFFLITQQPQAGALPNPDACGSDGQACETLPIGDMDVKYRLNKSTQNPGADTETLMWDSGGFSFTLSRVAGEPNKTYKDELLKVVGSMK
jgi:hypothetical protein